MEVELREDHCLAQHRSNEAKRGPVTSSALFAGKGDRRCAFCLENHLPEDCKKVTKTEERKKLLIKFGRCFKCINKGHRARD